MVAEMIDSVISNGFEDWELILVDDGSDEETLSMLRHRCECDDRICLIQRNEEPKGPLTCRNIGLRRAAGKYVVFFDSDDYVTPECIGTRVEAMESHPELDFMIFPSGEFVDGKIVPGAVTYAFGYPVWKDDIEAFASRILPFVVVNNIYRKESLTQHGIVWDTGLKSLEDADFNMQTILAGLKYAYATAEPDYGYRIVNNSGSLSKRMNDHAQSHIHALDKFYASIQDRFGHKYDRALFEGLMSVFTIVCRDAVDNCFANSLSALLHRYDRRHERSFRMMTGMISVLSRVMPERKARQAATFSHLLRYVIRLKKIKPYRVRKMIHCYETSVGNHSNI